MKKIFLLFLVCISASFASFIQAPIPPASKGHVYLDENLDGFIECLKIQFLGTLTEEYLAVNFDSLTFDAYNEKGNKIHAVFKLDDIKIDSGNTRQLLVSLKAKEKIQSPIFHAELFLKGEHFDLNLGDGEPPLIVNAELKSNRNEFRDSLKVEFSESVFVGVNCFNFLEIQSSLDSNIRDLNYLNVNWNNRHTIAIFELEQAHISSRDKIRIKPHCLLDSAKNTPDEKSNFVPIVGYYPFKVNFSSFAYDEDSGDKPVFQTFFEDANIPKESNAWRMSLEIMGDDFENTLKENLSKKDRENFDKSKVRIKSQVKIYSHLGAYVVGTKMEIAGDDERLIYEPTRLVLQWNFLDGMHRKVSSGVYIASALVVLEYDGRIVYRYLKNSNRISKIFGVKRK